MTNYSVPHATNGFREQRKCYIFPRSSISRIASSTSMRPNVGKTPPNPLTPPPPTPSNTPLSPHWLYDLQDIHDKLVPCFHNRLICPLNGFIVSTHRLSCPALPASAPPLPLVQTQPPMHFKTPTSLHRLYDIQGSVDKLVHFLPQLSDFIPLIIGLFSFRAQTD